MFWEKDIVKYIFLIYFNNQEIIECILKILIIYCVNILQYINKKIIYDEYNMQRIDIQ